MSLTNHNLKRLNRNTVQKKDIALFDLETFSCSALLTFEEEGMGGVFLTLAITREIGFAEATG